MSERYTKTVVLNDLQDTQHWARLIADAWRAPATFFLSGDLGAGKTTMAQTMIQAAGVTTPVKSPTFTLVEPYVLPNYAIYHFDFYRISSPDELEWIGIRDYFSDSAICIIEWPEKAADYWSLHPDLHVTLTRLKIAEQRQLSISAYNEKWVSWLKSTG